MSFTRTPFYNHWHEFPLLGNLSRCLNIGWPLYLEAAFIYDVRNNFLSTLNRKKLIARFITVIVNWVREVPWSTEERERIRIDFDSKHIFVPIFMRTEWIPLVLFTTKKRVFLIHVPLKCKCYNIKINQRTRNWKRQARLWCQHHAVQRTACAQCVCMCVAWNHGT